MRGVAKFSTVAVLSLMIGLMCPRAVSATDILATDIAIPANDIATIPVVTTVQPDPAPMLTYIDISIDNQTLAYYVNGSPVLVTPCVTGSPGRGTPKGVFQINSCVPGKYLNGKTWHVWVNRWMRFCGNVGIHDATWRKSFGGEIYKTNGSHGCVNIPHDKAIQLYSMVGVGTPVIVH